MKTIIFTNVTKQHHNSQSIWGINQPNTTTESGPYTIITADHVTPEMVAENFFGNTVIDYQYEILPVNN